MNSPDRSENRDNAYSIRAKTRINDHDRGRESRNNLLRSRRTESDHDNDIWNTIKPRKVSGDEDTNIFMNGSGGDKTRDEKILRDREENERKDKSWGSGFYSREIDTDNDHLCGRNPRNNGHGRGRTEPSWLKEKDNHEASSHSKDRQSNGDKYIDRNRGWRSKEKDDRIEVRSERFFEKEKPIDRRWDRSKEYRHENEPEWMEDPVEEKRQAHTLADFERWKEQMQGRDKVIKPMAEETGSDPEGPLFNKAKPKNEAPLDFDPGPDKFLGLFTANEDEISGSTQILTNEGASKSKIVGKASRFTSFFSAQDDSNKASSESQSATQIQSPSALNTPPQSSTQSDAEKEAFQQLLQKLQRQTLQASGLASPGNVSYQPKSSISKKTSSTNASPLDLFQNFPNERQNEGRINTHLSQQNAQDLFTQRQMSGSQNTIRPEQMLQELVSQRQNALCQPSTRVDQQTNRTNNTEFLMGLMQGSKSAPDAQRSDHILHGMPPKPDNRQMPQHPTNEREHEIQRETASHRERTVPERHSRPQSPPGFFEESLYPRGPALPHDRQSGNAQSAQLIQRPPPPGLDMSWERQAHLQPPQHRHVQNIAPPPGLLSGLNRPIPIAQQAFPPGFSMGNFPPPEVMGVSPRNIQMQPPPGFFNGPHGFLPPGIGGFQGPESMAFGGAPFDGRGPPPQGSFRRQ